MGQLIEKYWDGSPTALTRRERMPAAYSAYLPDLLSGRAFSLESDVAADVADAERALAQLDQTTTYLADTEALARLLLRAESVASSRIEGLEVGARRLLRAEAALALGLDSTDVTAKTVLDNIRAMALGVQQVTIGTPITLDMLLGIHAQLMASSAKPEHTGKLRTVQNWIGGSDYTPHGADFVPPPWEDVQPLMQDLCIFCNRDDLPAVAQAAVAHAQFETIHPFVDGNGRTGRALTHLIMRRRSLTLNVLAPVSLVLATHARAYIQGLTAYRSIGPADSAPALAGANAWIAAFAGACQRAAAQAGQFEALARSIEQGWRASLGRVRANSIIDLLLPKLIGMPIFTVSAAATLSGRSFQRTNEAIERLVQAGIIKQVSIGGKKRNRAFEAPAALAAFQKLERSLASPEADTRIARPVRRVPHRG